MPKFFVISDVHSFYTPMKEALDAAGFDPDDEDHWLISAEVTSTEEANQ